MRRTTTGSALVALLFLLLWRWWFSPSLNNSQPVLVRTRTDPSFAIFLYQPENDIISRKIVAHQVYEPEETNFLRSISQPGAWAVDIGANVGFHSLHLVALGMNVVALEPSPDSMALLRQSIAANDGFRTRMHTIQAAASNTTATGRLVRHADSPGMTILQSTTTHEDSLPFGVKAVMQQHVQVVRVQDVLAKILSDSVEKLLLVKIDVEGYELQALVGLNLTRFSSMYLVLEVFPELLIKAGGTDPWKLLLYIASIGYQCSTEPNFQDVWDTSNLELWYETHVQAGYKKSSRYHINIYCRQESIKK